MLLYQFETAGNIVSLRAVGVVAPAH